MGIDNPMTQGEYYPGGRSRQQYIEDCRALIEEKEKAFNVLAESIEELKVDILLDEEEREDEIEYLEFKMFELEKEIAGLEEEIKSEER